MRRFEQAVSKNKVQHNAISPPCKAKAQTKILEFMLPYVLTEYAGVFILQRKRGALEWITVITEVLFS